MHMKRKAYSLVEILVGLFILGLITTTVMPIIHTSFNSLGRAGEKMEMLHLAEEVAENLRGKPENYQALLEELEEKEKVTFTDLSEKYREKYGCQLIDMGSSDKFWKLKILVDKRKGSSYVELELKLPKT